MPKYFHNERKEELINNFKKRHKSLPVSADATCRYTMARSMFDEYIKKLKSTMQVAGLITSDVKRQIAFKVETAMNEMRALKPNFMSGADWATLYQELFTENNFPVDIIPDSEKIKMSFVASMPKRLMDEETDNPADAQDMESDSQTMRKLLPAKESLKAPDNIVNLSTKSQMYAEGYYELVVGLARTACSDPWFKTI